MLGQAADLVITRFFTIIRARNVKRTVYSGIKRSRKIQTSNIVSLKASREESSENDGREEWNSSSNPSPLAT